MIFCATRAMKNQFIVVTIASAWSTRDPMVTGERCEVDARGQLKGVSREREIETNGQMSTWTFFSLFNHHYSSFKVLRGQKKDKRISIVMIAGKHGDTFNYIVKSLFSLSLSLSYVCDRMNFTRYRIHRKICCFSLQLFHVIDTFFFLCQPHVSRHRSVVFHFRFVFIYLPSPPF